MTLTCMVNPAPGIACMAVLGVLSPEEGWYVDDNGEPAETLCIVSRTGLTEALARLTDGGQPHHLLVIGDPVNDP